MSTTKITADQAREAMKAGKRLRVTIDSGDPEGDPTLILFLKDGEIISEGVKGWSEGVTEAVCDLESDFLTEYLEGSYSDADRSVEIIEPEAAPHPNHDVIAGLMEAAVFLSEHPELPEVQWASILLRHEYMRNSPARETLTILAEALGERAAEVANRDSITIEGEFAGGVKVKASAARSDLADAPPVVIDYEPIIKREPVAEDTL